MPNRYTVTWFKCGNGDLCGGVKCGKTSAAVYWGAGKTEAATWADAERVANGLNNGVSLERLTAIMN